MTIRAICLEPSRRSCYNAKADGVDDSSDCSWSSINTAATHSAEATQSNQKRRLHRLPYQKGAPCLAETWLTSCKQHFGERPRSPYAYTTVHHLCSINTTINSHLRLYDNVKWSLPTFPKPQPLSWQPHGIPKSQVLGQNNVGNRRDYVCVDRKRHQGERGGRIVFALPKGAYGKLIITANRKLHRRCRQHLCLSVCIHLCRCSDAVATLSLTN